MNELTDVELDKFATYLEDLADGLRLIANKAHELKTHSIVRATRTDIIHLSSVSKILREIEKE